MKGVSLGRNAKFYLNTGSYGSPTWAEIPEISELVLAGESESVAVPTRESAVKMEVTVELDLTITGKFKFVPGDANQTTIIDAYYTRGVIDIMALSGPNTSTGHRGVRYECQVKNNGQDQGASVALLNDIKFTPTPTANGAPKMAKVVAGAVVFTDL